MSRYLAKLKGEWGTPKKGTPPTDKTDKTPESKNGELTKLPKPGFVSSASANPRPCRTPLASMSRSRREAITQARDAAPLCDFWAALTLGRLMLCGNCARFNFGEEPAQLGHCRRFDVEAWPFVPFWCSGFELSATPAAAAYLPDPDGSRALSREYSK